MRDRRGWHRRCSPQQLTEAWPTNLGSFRPGDLLDVELGLYLLENVTPSRTAADVWPLLGGYPYSEVFGDVRTDEQRLRVLRARHYLWDMRRRHAWSEALADYLKVPQHLRGYDTDGPGSVPRRRAPHAASRSSKNCSAPLRGSRRGPFLSPKRESTPSGCRTVPSPWCSTRNC
nr:hypothetical protein [Streptomyces sp. AA0539]